MIIGNGNNSISIAKGFVLNSFSISPLKTVLACEYVEVVGYEDGMFVIRLDDTLNLYKTPTENIKLIVANTEVFTWSPCAINNSCVPCGCEDDDDGIKSIVAENLLEATQGHAIHIIKVPRGKKQTMGVSIGKFYGKLPLSAVFANKVEAEHALLVSKLPIYAVA